MKIKRTTTGFEIAIIGMAGKFPGAPDLKTFWDNLIAGRESITPLSDAELQANGVHPEIRKHPGFVRSKGLFPELEYFDAEFFEYTPRDAAVLDPQVRALHECVYLALEDAGYADPREKRNIGVFAGASGNFTWELSTLIDASQSSAHQLSTIQLNDKDFLATRIAYKLNLQGPCATVHTACSTSLYAVDVACRNLLTGACQMAIAAGSGLTLPHKNGYAYEEGMIKSADGTCRPFSDAANGTVEGNGVGAVLLKPLEAALADGDRIYAVIRGIAANNDGHRKVGYTAPSVEGQAEVIRRALRMAETPCDSISYVECHGTGTRLGDPVEIEGLRKAFRTNRRGFCSIGSLKSNIGHLDAAAGISSLIKTVLVLKNQTIPPSLHFDEPNREIDFTNSPFKVATSLTPLKRPAAEFDPNGEVWPLRAGVSSFGIGGTNVHVVLEEAPPTPNASGIPSSRKTHLLCLSGRNPGSLQRQESALRAYLEQNPDVDPADLAFTYQVGRSAMPARCAIPFEDISELRQQLQVPASERGLFFETAPREARVAFLYPGQGTQFLGMAEALSNAEPAFREELEKCLVLCDNLGACRIRPLIAGSIPSDVDINQTSIAQVALFVVEYSLAQCLLRWGIQPAAMIGHSLGEYVAAAVAGVMPLEEALRLVILRGRLMQEMPSGGMLAVMLPEKELLAILPAGLDLAAVNAPSQCVVSGPVDSVQAFAQSLATQGISAKVLKTSHAFHSASMEPMMDAFRSALQQTTFKAPSIPYISNLTGRWITNEEACDPEYYLRHLRQPVRFAAGAQTLLEDSRLVCVELGPGNVLSAFLRQNSPKPTPSQSSGESVATVSLLRGARQEVEGHNFFLRGLGALWGQGVSVDWRKYYQGELRTRTNAPGYRFEPRPYTLGRGDIYTLFESLGSGDSQASATTSENSPLQSFAWQPVLLPPNGDPLGLKPCLLFSVGGLCRKYLRQIGGLRLTTLTPGKSFQTKNAEALQLDFRRTSDLRRLFQHLRQQDGVPELFVWALPTLWRNLTPENAALVEASNSLATVAGILKDECPNQTFRCVVLVPLRVVEIPQETAADLNSLALRLRSVFPGFSLRWVFLPAQSPRERLLNLMDREIHDSNQQFQLIQYRDSQRFAYQARSTVLSLEHPTGNVGVKMGVLGGSSQIREAVASSLREFMGGTVHVLPGPESVLKGSANLKFDADLQRLGLLLLQNSFLSEHGLADSQAHYALMDELSTTLVARYIHTVHPLTPGSTLDRASLKLALGITDRLDRYVDYFLHLLESDGLLQRCEAGWVVLRGPDTLRPPEVVASEIRRVAPLFRGQVRLLEHCVEAFPQALREKISPIEVLYPKGTNQLLRETYENSVQDREDEYVRQLFERHIRSVIAKSKRLRILEAGGGYGLVMRRIVPLLAKVAKVEYYFTDVGSTFLQDARQFALEQGYDFMTFGLFDISKPPFEQGLDPDSFDLVFSFNVVHATRNLRESLRNLYSLLKPNGLLCLLERTKVRRHVDLIWGLADGWWHFDHQDGRQLSPLVPLERWQQLAGELEPKSILALPEDPVLREKVDVGLLVVEKSSPSLEETSSEPADLARADVPIRANLLWIIDAPADLRRPTFQSYARYGQSTEGEGRAVLESVQDALRYHKPRQAVVLSMGEPSATALEELDRQAFVRGALRVARQLGSLTSHIWLPYPEGGTSHRRESPFAEDLKLALLGAESHLAQAVVRLSAQRIFSTRQSSPGATVDASVSQPRSENAVVPLENTNRFVPILQSLWSELFGISAIRPTDDFFALGGDSLKAAQVTTELEKHGIKILPNEVFNFPRLLDLANHIQQNYGGSLTLIRDKAQLVSQFQERFGLAADLVEYSITNGCWENDQLYRVLYLPDAVCEDPAEVESSLLSQHLVAEIQPHFVFPVSWKPTAAPVSAEQFAAEFHRKIVEHNSEFGEIIHRAKVRQARFSLRIREGAVEHSYPLSAFQKMYLRGTTRVSLYQIEFDELLDRQALDEAFADILNLQGLLRSSLDRGFQRLSWKQHRLPSCIHLPEIDLSVYSDDSKREILQRIMAQEYEANFDAENGVMYHVLLVRFDLRRHVLLFNLDHSIFDNMSGQVLRRQLINRYRARRAGNVSALKPVKPFSDYLRQIGRGPQGLQPAQLIKLFDLEAYGRASHAIEQKIIAQKQKKVQTLRFEVDLAAHRLSDDEEVAWEVALLILSFTLSRYFDRTDIPLKLIYQGRKYQDYSFFDTLGLFVDIVPLLLRVRPEDPEAMIADVQEKLNYINRHNLNFMNLVLNLGMMVRWQSVLGPISPRKLSKSDPMILLNYAGKAEKEYRKIIDFATSQMLNTENRLSYASFYTIATVTDGKLIFDVLCDFEPEMQRLKDIFVQQSEVVLSIHSQRVNSHAHPQNPAPLKSAADDSRELLEIV